jgi:hypothetical protein
MGNLFWYLAIIGAVTMAALADSVGTLWANSENKFSIYLLLIFILGPLVFISFGLITTKTGLAIASGVVNSLLVLTSISIGLLFFGEWSKLSFLQYTGIAFALMGIVLMLFFPKIQH